MQRQRPAAIHADPASAPEERLERDRRGHRTDPGGGAGFDPHPVLAQDQCPAIARAGGRQPRPSRRPGNQPQGFRTVDQIGRATSELQSLMRISYAVFCLTTKKNKYTTPLPSYSTLYIILTFHLHTYPY